MIAKASSEPSAPRKNEPPQLAARCITSRVPDTSQDCTCAADISACACSQVLMRAIQGNCWRSENDLISISVADFCSCLSSADICETNSTDSALKGRRMTMGASTVSTPAAIDLPLKRRRQRTLMGNSRNARNAAQAMDSANGLKISSSAYPRTAATARANTLE